MKKKHKESEVSMITKILSALKQNQILTYLISEYTTESIELFFIKKRLDMHREKYIHNYEVTVYHEFEKDNKKMLGSSTISIQSGMTMEEINNKLKDAYFAASFVCNPYYELMEGEQKEPIIVKSSLAETSLSQNAKKMTQALFEEDNKKDAFLNSAELFVIRTTKHIINSRGVDVSYTTNQVNGEFVAQCKEPQDVELYQNFHYDELDIEALKAKVKNTLEMTKARAKAVKAPEAGSYQIILSGEYVKELLGFYISRSSSGMIYPKYSSYEIGTKVQGEEVQGEDLTITLKAKEPYSQEGIPMIDRTLFEQGELKTIHGGCRFAYYLGTTPTGTYSNYVMPAGTKSIEEMKKESGICLHIVNFSDFQMDAFTGHFGGEIRLAFLIDEDNITPVTGGSINGSILEVQNNLTFSTEIQIEKGFQGPLAVSLNGITVAGY